MKEFTEEKNLYLKKVKIFLWWQGPWLAVCIGLFVLSSLSHPPKIIPFPDGFPNADKFSHGIFYFFLAVLSLRGFRKLPHEYISKHFIILAFSFCVFYGVTDEWHQLFVEGRSCEFWDWVADVLGATAGVCVYLLHRKIKEKQIS